MPEIRGVMSSCSPRVMKHVNHSVILLLDQTLAEASSCRASEPEVVISPFGPKGSRQRQLLRGQEIRLYLSLLWVMDIC